VLTIIHDIPKRSFWHSISKPQWAFIADGKGIPVTKFEFLDLRKDSPSDYTFYETFIGDIPYDSFKAITSSSEVEVNIGGGSFKLSSDTLKALKYYSERVAR
jgi:hypothetical protein